MKYENICITQYMKKFSYKIQVILVSKDLFLSQLKVYEQLQQAKLHEYMIIGGMK